MTKETGTFTTTNPTDDLARKIAAGELVAGGIIAEFANGRDAADFARAKGDGYTVTPGINLVFAVRPWITVEQKAAQELPIAQGDKVRSFDFADRRDCYIEGTVIELVEREGCERYRILVERRVWNGEPVKDSRQLGAYAFPPVNGTPTTLGRTCNGVERVS